MTTPEMTNSYEQNRLDFMAKQLEKNNTPRELAIKYILSHEQERKTQAAKEEMEEQRDMYKHLYYTRLDEVAALMDKLNAIQAIINPDQAQE